MKNLNIENATKRYNRIMNSICREHLTIGQRLSEDTEGWNLRDMVSECQYQLDTYYEYGHCNEDMRHGDEDERKAWRSETGRLSRFIKAYEPFIGDMICESGHCSKYDN